MFRTAKFARMKGGGKDSNKAIASLYLLSFKAAPFLFSPSMNTTTGLF
jgi:hypothetical protein